MFPQNVFKYLYLTLVFKGAPLIGMNAGTEMALVAFRPDQAKNNKSNLLWIGLYMQIHTRLWSYRFNIIYNTPREICMRFYCFISVISAVLYVFIWYSYPYYSMGLIYLALTLAIAQSLWSKPEDVDKHYDDVTMSLMASQITSLTIVYSIVYSDADQRKHQSSASLAFVRGIQRGPVNSPHKWPVMRNNVSIWWRHHEIDRYQITVKGRNQMSAFASCAVLYIWISTETILCVLSF